VSDPTRCALCGGHARLLYRGSPGTPDPAALAPTNHEVGDHGDLFACTSCGTVAQPSLPGGEELRSLYRRMNDTAYLDEEDGRRRAARRLLDMVERRVAAGRLLDAGCGHGMLLDEARRRGWETVGLDLSAAAAAHARDTLGLDVRERPLEQFTHDGGFDAVVLADVIEHVDDPAVAIDRCFELLVPGGVALFATPDPASRVARLAGRRWWGYLRAHTFLLPRETLARLLAERGLEPLSHRPLVRTFSAAYWFRGASQRGGALGSVGSLAGRAVPAGLTLSLTLRDEYVLLARRPDSRVESRRPASARASPARSTR
jgi:2-polyprenyl-3-methyl-5-hydroxy-6-metoxy-1,4-benzoquinol methylase